MSNEDQSARAGDGNAPSLTEEQIDAIAKPFIRELGGDHWHSGEDGIRDNSDLYEFARALLAAAPAVSAPAWQPIETAPKERGGLVDIICNERRYAGCHYDRICDEYRHITACGVLIRLKGATHWMAPPAAPGIPSPATADGSVE